MGLTGKSAEHIIQDFLAELDPPIRLRERPDPDKYSHQVIGLFSMKELVERAQRDILPWVLENLGSQISLSVAQVVMTDKFEAIVLAALKDEIRAQVKAAVAQRIDEFVEEVL